MNREHPPDEAWSRINSLGGRHSGDDYSLGYASALSDALAIIEDLGGKDPLVRRAENSRGGVGA